jgi:hypothetical protein
LKAFLSLLESTSSSTRRRLIESKISASLEVTLPLLLSSTTCVRHCSCSRRIRILVSNEFDSPYTPFVERTQNEVVEACGIVYCVTKGMLVRRQVACLEDIQYWHIKLFYYFDLLVIKVLYPRVTAIGHQLLRRYSNVTGAGRACYIDIGERYSDILHWRKSFGETPIKSLMVH